MYQLYVPYQIKGSYSSGYPALANESAEGFNKAFYTILEEMVSKNKRTSPDELPESLVGLQNHNHNQTQAIPNSLVFMGEAALLLELYR